MAELNLSIERGHLIETTVYDEHLKPIRAEVAPRTGQQMDGHRSDCRCSTCRPDVHVT